MCRMNARTLYYMCRFACVECTKQHIQQYAQKTNLSAAGYLIHSIMWSSEIVKSDLTLQLGVMDSVLLLVIDVCVFTSLLCLFYYTLRIASSV